MGFDFMNHDTLNCQRAEEKKVSVVNYIYFCDSAACGPPHRQNGGKQETWELAYNCPRFIAPPLMRT